MMRLQWTTIPLDAGGSSTSDYLLLIVVHCRTYTLGTSHSMFYVPSYVIPYFLLFIDLIIAYNRTTPANDHLIELATALPTYIVHCREDNTINKYHSAFTAWTTWADKHDVSAMPGRSANIALFLLVGGDCHYRYV